MGGKVGQAAGRVLNRSCKSKPTGQCDLPFIFLHSQQTKQRSPDKNSKFPLFIEIYPQSTPVDGPFDCYGLSRKVNGIASLGTVPYF
ncbi:type I-F CRISPR-associated endoribonuclease Cas6/Csy4 [Shewanella sp. JL219SE-S6]